MNPVNSGANRSCFAVFVANTWGSPVTLGVEQNGATLPIASFAYVPQGSGTTLTYSPLTGALAAGSIAILFSPTTEGAAPSPLRRRAQRSTAPASARHSTSRRQRPSSPTNLALRRRRERHRQRHAALADERVGRQLHVHDCLPEDSHRSVDCNRRTGEQHGRHHQPDPGGRRWHRRRADRQRRAAHVHDPERRRAQVPASRRPLGHSGAGDQTGRRLGGKPVHRFPGCRRRGVRRNAQQLPR